MFFCPTVTFSCRAVSLEYRESPMILSVNLGSYDVHSELLNTHSSKQMQPGVLTCKRFFISMTVGVYCMTSSCVSSVGHGQVRDHSSDCSVIHAHVTKFFDMQYGKGRWHFKTALISHQ